MKKITLLLLLALPVMGFAQTWDFTNTDDGWEGAAGATITVNAESITMDFPEDKSPKIRRQTGMGAGIDPLAVDVIAVTVKNTSDAELLRIKHDKLVSGGNRFVFVPIEANNAEFVTYYVELDGAEWDNDGAGGVHDNLEVIFRSADNMNIATAGSIEIDKIEMLDAIPTTLKLDYNFSTDDDAENWEPLGDAVVAVSNDALIFSFGGEAQPKISQQAHHVTADDNQYVNISIANLSMTDDQMRVSYPDPVNGGRVFRTVEIATNTTDFDTYQLNLASEAWTGEVSDIQIAFRNAASGMSDGAGAVTIDRILFTDQEILGVDTVDVANVALYPNPTSNFFSIQNAKDVQNVTIYTVTGKQVASYSNVTEAINVTTLASGVYLVKINGENTSVIKKLIVSNK